MDIIVIDFETYYDKEYSLSKMQTDAYIYDPRFEVIGLSVKRNDGATEWFSGDMKATEKYLRTLNIHECAVVGHNLLFDGYILTQRFGLNPKMWIDTLGMAKALHPYRIKFSLATLAGDLLGKQKGTEVHNMIGKRRTDLTPTGVAAYGEYCKNDTELTYELFKLFYPQFPAIELKIMDMVIRMFTEPKFVGDIAALRKLYADELARKDALLELANVDRTVVMSNDKLAQQLMDLGVRPPMKISSRTGKATYAFAKSDKEFTELLEHPESEVQNLVAARLGVKTTIAETRALMMLNTAERGPLPVYLNYWGAKTTGRLSGGNKINWQNLPARGISAGIRHAIKAPDGCKLVVGDSSNIELRVAMACAGETEVLEKLANGVDLYCDFASKLFGRTITKADIKERLLGKIAMLSLQYGAGPDKFKEMVRLQTGQQLTDEESRDIVYTYRRTFSRVSDLWRHCNDVILPDIYNDGGLVAVDVNGWAFTVSGGFMNAGHPAVQYKGLRKNNDGDWVYAAGKEYVKIYGGKLVENLCQYLARNIVMWQTAKQNERYPVALSVHDEMVCVVPDDEVQDCERYMLKCLQDAPKWCRGQIPLTGETGVGQTYADAK